MTPANMDINYCLSYLMTCYLQWAEIVNVYDCVCFMCVSLFVSMTVCGRWVNIKQFCCAERSETFHGNMSRYLCCSVGLRNDESMCVCVCVRKREQTDADRYAKPHKTDVLTTVNWQCRLCSQRWEQLVLPDSRQSGRNSCRTALCFREQQPLQTCGCW